MEKNEEISLFASLHVQYSTGVSMHWTNDHTVYIEKVAPGTKTGRKFFVINDTSIKYDTDNGITSTYLSYSLTGNLVQNNASYKDYNFCTDTCLSCSKILNVNVINNTLKY